MILPEGWAGTTLGDVADFVMGQAPPGADCNTAGEGTPFVKAGEFGSSRPVIREWTTKPLKLAQHDDVLICVVGATAGKLNLGADCAIGRSVAAIRPSAATSADFIYPRLRSEVSRLRGASTGTAQGVISKEMLAEINLALPPSAEQRRIVAKLDALTARLARARAELDRVPMLATHIRNAVLTDIFSPKADIRAARVGDIAQLINGDRGTHYPSDAEQLSEGHCLFLGTRNVRIGRFDFAQCSFVTEAKHRSMSNGTLARNDIVLTIRGTLGNCAVYDSSVPFEPVRINSAMLIARVRTH